MLKPFLPCGGKGRRSGRERGSENGSHVIRLGATAWQAVKDVDCYRGRPHAPLRRPKVAHAVHNEGRQRRAAVAQKTRRPRSKRALPPRTAAAPPQAARRPSAPPLPATKTARAPPRALARGAPAATTSAAMSHCPHHAATNVLPASSSQNSRARARSPACAATYARLPRRASAGLRAPTPAPHSQRRPGPPGQRPCGSRNADAVATKPQGSMPCAGATGAQAADRRRRPPRNRSRSFGQQLGLLR